MSSLLMIFSFASCAKQTHFPILQSRSSVSDHDLRQLTRKAEQGDVTAQFNLGRIYYKGQGIKRNYPEALKWFKKAAQQAHGMSQYHLGLMYDKGHIGVPRNNVDAYIWYGFAAEQGVEDAINNIVIVESQMTTSEIAIAKKKSVQMRTEIMQPAKKTGLTDAGADVE